MSAASFHKLWKMIGLRYKSHPWHGIPIGKPLILANGKKHYSDSSDSDFLNQSPQTKPNQ